MILKNKKGIPLNQAFGAVLTLVIIAVLVIVGIILFVNLAVSFSGNAGSVTGESLIPTTNGTSVSNVTNCNFANFGLTTAVNATGSLIDSANYTTTSGGLVLNTTTTEPNVPFTSSPWTLNYSFTDGNEACVASQDMIAQFGTYPALIGLVGTIIFLGLVIGVLVASFVFGRKEGL